MKMDRALLTRAAWVAGSLVWALLVFQVALWLTFPSDSMSRWLVYQVSARVPGYHAELGSVRPWWTGVAVRDAKLFVQGAEAPTLVALAERVRGRVSPWALLTGGYDVRGDVTLIDGTAHYRVGLRPDERGRMLLTDLSVRSDDMPLAELLPLLPLTEVPAGSGLLDIEVELEAGEEGLRQASGRIVLTGTNLVISDLSTEMTGPLGMEIPIQELKIEAPIEDGKATITQGIASGELATIEIEGDLVLRDPISRSTLDLRLLISNLGPSLQPMAGFLGTPHSDGKYHFQVRGLASRPSVTAARESTISSSGRVSPGTTSGYTSPTSAAESAEEREKRIAEAQERARQRREERERQAGDVPPTRSGPPIEEDPAEDGEDPSFEGDELEDEIDLEVPAPTEATPEDVIIDRPIEDWDPEE